MKTVGRMLCLLLVLCMTAALAPFAAFAEEETRTMRFAVNAGQSIAVWNDDIAASGVTSNKITVQVDEGTYYDAVFPESSDTAAALSYHSEGLLWETSDYVKTDVRTGDGMLIWISVSAGQALLTVESTGQGMGAQALSPYAMSSSPLVSSAVITFSSWPACSSQGTGGREAMNSSACF